MEFLLCGRLVLLIKDESVISRWYWCVCAITADRGPPLPIIKGRRFCIPLIYWRSSKCSLFAGQRDGADRDTAVAPRNEPVLRDIHNRFADDCTLLAAGRPRAREYYLSPRWWFCSIENRYRVPSSPTPQPFVRLKGSYFISSPHYDSMTTHNISRFSSINFAINSLVLSSI